MSGTKVKMAPRGGKRSLMDENISYDMERLFDPYNFDHIPKEKRLQLFKQRDLPHIKHYKAAVKIFGGPPIRTRAIVAPPMETPLKHRLGVYHNTVTFPAAPALNGPLKSPPEPVKELTKEEKEQNQELEKVANYKSWIAKRKMLRGDLDNLGLNESLLARKPDKSELEKRVQAKFRADRLWKPETPEPVEVTPSPKPPPDVPAMTVPAPDGLQILDRYLSLNRMRLMDLFLIADKDKSWSVSRQEFLDAVSKSEIPMSESEVDDIMLTLDGDLDDELTYQELNKGLTQWRKERRNIKRQGGGNVEKKTSSASSADSKGKSTKKDSVKEEKVDLQQQEQNKGAKSPSQGQGREKPATAEKSVKAVPNQILGDRFSRESTKKVQTREAYNGERSDSAKQREQSVEFVEVRELSDLETPKKSREGRSKTEDETSLDYGHEVSSLSFSQQRAQLSDNASTEMPFSRENASADRTKSEALPLESQMDKSVFEDMLFHSGDTPRAKVSAEDVGEEEEKSAVVAGGQRSKVTSSAKDARPGSNRTSSSSRSRASTPNSLEPPEPDSRLESRASKSPEAIVDIRKRDRVVLSRNNIRRSLSREQRVTFDELPGVIKVGYKPIDDHCSESTLGGEVANMVNQFRREKLKEYFDVKKLCEEGGFPLTQKALDRVLLYPGDKPTTALRKGVVMPLGPLTNEISPFNQPQPKKRLKKRRRGLARISRAASRNGANVSGIGGVGTGGTSSAGGMGGGGDGSGSTQGGGRKGHQDDETEGSGSSKRGYLTVEDVYPSAATVTPKVYKENLSSGRALISRKVDNWMTFEEYSKYTQNLQNRFQHLNRKSNPSAAWPGSLLDKLRLYMDHEGPVLDGHGRPLENRDSCAYEGYGVGKYNGRGNAVFRHTSQPKRAYPGYNNDLLTWPVGDNGVRYATIDDHRLVK